METEILGAIGAGGVAAGAAAATVWHRFSGAGRANGKAHGKINGTHCPDHEAMVRTLTIVENNVAWLRQAKENDTTSMLLDGILNHLTRNRHEPQS